MNLHVLVTITDKALALLGQLPKVLRVDLEVANVIILVQLRILIEHELGMVEDTRQNKSIIDSALLTTNTCAIHTDVAHLKAFIVLVLFTKYKMLFQHSSLGVYDCFDFLVLYETVLVHLSLLLHVGVGVGALKAHVHLHAHSKVNSPLQLLLHEFAASLVSLLGIDKLESRTR